MGVGGKKPTIGYKYYLGMHMVLCHGPIDSLRRIVVDKRIAWQGYNTGGALEINAEGLFGGETKEGGVSGTVDVEFGADDQAQNTYLQSQLGTDIPAFRGVMGVVLNQCYLGMNPYLKRWGFRAQRIYVDSLGDEQWYAEKAGIGSLDSTAIYIAFDTSDSMDTVTSNGDTRLENLQEALDEVLLHLKGMDIVFDMHVSAWDASVNYQTHYSASDANFESLRTFVAAVSTDPGTDFEQAFDNYETFFTTTTSSNKVMIFVTDGLPSPEAGPVETQLANANGAAALRDDVAGVDVFGINIDQSSTVFTEVVDNTANDGVPVIDGADPTAILNAVLSAISGHIDMNPAHIIRECLTSTTWGMGYPAADIDDTSFTAAADTLFAENMGISLLWDRQIPIEDFIKEIIRHINAALFVDKVSGKFTLKLIRDDYTVASLLELDETNIIGVKEYSRTDQGDAINSVSVVYWDQATGENGGVTADDIALIQATGNVVNTTIQYPGFTNVSVAGRAAARDLQIASTPLLSAKIEANREASGLNIGDTFKFTWSEYHTGYVVMRVHAIAYGDGKNNRVKIDATEDIFAFPNASYTAPEAPGWEDPSAVVAEPAEYEIALELPYYELVQELGQVDADAILTAEEDAGFLCSAVARPGPSYLNALMNVDDGAGYEQVATLDFSPHCLLSVAAEKLDTVFYFVTETDIEDVTLGTHALINSEIVRIDAIDTVAGTVTVGRGCLDTVPIDHDIGDALVFWSAFIDGSDTEYVASDDLDVKILPATGQGVLAEADATAINVVMDSRAIRPYPPGKFQVNGNDFNIGIMGEATLNWVHRDRTQQTAGEIVDFYDATIGPETDVTYTIKIYDEEDSLLRTVTGEADLEYIYTEANELLDRGESDFGVALTFEMYSVRDGYDSFQTVWHTVYRSGWGIQYGYAYGSLTTTVAITWTNFSEYTTSAQPSDWTEQWVDTGVTHEVIATSGLGSKGLEVDVSSNGRHVLGYDPLDGTDDVEVLIIGQQDSNASNATYLRVVLRGGEGGSGEEGYVFQFRANTDKVEIRKVVNGTFSLLTDTAFTWAVNTDYWVRFQVIGTALKARVWEDGDTEPGTWTLETTDSALTSGFVGIGSQTSGIVTFDYFAWGLDGDTAPSP